jgi:hypothetical protein
VALRRKAVLLAVGYTLVAATTLTFATYLVLKVLGGQALETYDSGKAVRWSYGGALVGLVALLSAATVACVIRLVSWFRTRRELALLAHTQGKSRSSGGSRDATSPNKSLERTRVR